MRILVWDEGCNHGGIDRVTSCLLPQIANRVDCIDWLAPTNRIDEFSHLVHGVSNIQVRNLHDCWNDAKDKLINALLRRLRRFTQRNKRLQRHAVRLESSQRLRSFSKRLGSTILYVPALLNHPFPRVNIPCIATLHDLNFRGESKLECMASVREWGESSSGVICISQTVRNAYESCFPNHLAPAVTITNGVDVMSKRSVSQRPVNGSDSLRVYYPASLYPHKNHELLLRALLKAIKLRGKIELVLTGVETDRVNHSDVLSDSHQETVRQLVQQINSIAPHSVRGLGYVTSEEVEQQYASADIVAIPSEFEGFGLPLSESLLRGIPVVCCDLAVFREQMELFGIRSGVIMLDNELEAWVTLLMQLASSRNKLPTVERFDSNEQSSWDWSKAGDRYFDFFSSCN
jgi:glycosyltransferase involved in cell wall biosynthesis